MYLVAGAELHPRPTAQNPGWFPAEYRCDVVSKDFALLGSSSYVGAALPYVPDLPFRSLSDNSARQKCPFQATVFVFPISVIHIFMFPHRLRGVYWFPCSQTWESRSCAEYFYTYDDNFYLQFFHPPIPKTIPAPFGPDRLSLLAMVSSPSPFDLGPSGTLWLYASGNKRSQSFFFLYWAQGSENHDGQCQMPNGHETLPGRLCSACRHLRVSFLTAVFTSNLQSLASYVRPGCANGRAGGVSSRERSVSGGGGGRTVETVGECTCFSSCVYKMY